MIIGQTAFRRSQKRFRLPASQRQRKSQKRKKCDALKEKQIDEDILRQVFDFHDLSKNTTENRARIVALSREKFLEMNEEKQENGETTNPSISPQLQVYSIKDVPGNIFLHLNFNSNAMWGLCNLLCV